MTAHRSFTKSLTAHCSVPSHRPMIPPNSFGFEDIQHNTKESTDEKTTAHCLLLTAHCSLPAAHCSVPMLKCPGDEAHPSNRWCDAELAITI